MNRPLQIANATVTAVASSATVVTLAAGNIDRGGLIIHNDSTAVLRIKYGAGASASSFSERIEAKQTFYLPEPIFTGQITGIWESVDGNAYVTEF